MASSSSSSSPSSSSGTPRRGIRLRRYAQVRYVANAVDGYRFRVVAYGAYDMPNEIFRYLRRPLNPNTGEQADEFDGVCSVPDLEEYPVSEPTGAPPFFRLAEIDLVFRSQSQADEAWTVIQQEVEILYNSLNYADELETASDVVVGDPPPADPPE